MTRIAHKTRLEGDSTTALDVPAGVDLPAGYLDGLYVTVPTLKHRFPGKRIVAGTVNGSTSGADFIDCEAGDAKPPTAARYVKTERRKHHWPTIYFPLSDIAAVCHELKALGLGPDVPLWTAHYTGKAHLCGSACLKPYGPLPFTPLIVATQYADPAHGSGGHFDLSAVADFWPGVDPVPVVKATPLSRLSRVLAVRLTRLAARLTRRLARRDVPLSSGETVLVDLEAALNDLNAQIRRIFATKESK